MKNALINGRIIVVFFCLSLLTNFTFGQGTPEKFNYQAVLRNSSGDIITNQPVGVLISILETSSNGPVVYAETHLVNTNQFGLINLEIGTGATITGSFPTISWHLDHHFIQIEVDENGGSNYQLLGTSQLLSVPYALHAKTVELEQQDLTLSGTNLSITNGSTVDLSGIDSDTQLSESQVDAYVSNNGYITSPDDADADPTNEIQTLGLSGNDLSISGGNAVNLSGIDTDTQLSEAQVDAYVANNGYITSPNDADADPTNEYNTGISLTGTILSVDDNGGPLTVDLSPLQDGVNDADADPANEYNTSASFSGTTLSITDGGGTMNVDLSSLQDGVNDADTDPTNEIQTLNLSGNDLSISGGNTVTLPSGGGSGHWSKTGNKIYTTTDSIGIGTSLPDYPLEIRTPNTSNEYGFVHNNGTVKSGSHIDYTVDAASFGTITNHDFFISVNNSPRTTYLKNGNTIFHSDSIDLAGNSDFVMKKRPTLTQYGNRIVFAGQSSSAPTGIGGDIMLQSGQGSINGGVDIYTGSNHTFHALEGNVRIGDNTSTGYNNTQIALGVYEIEEKLTVATPTNKYGLLHTNGNIKLGTYLGGAQSDAYFGTKSNHDLHLFTNDGSPILTVSTDDKVGINKDTPTKELDVVGDAHIEGNVTWKAQESFLSISPSDFNNPGYYWSNSTPNTPIVQQLNIVSDTTLTWQDGYGGGYRSNARAPLHLPHGATILEVTTTIKTGNTISIHSCWEIFRIPFSTGIPERLMVKCVVPTSTNIVQSGSGTNITSPVIDNENYRYEIVIGLNDYATYGREIVGSVIKYSTTRPH